jgi:translation initiation factor 2 alpha subunit (eIF-2alpha)
VHNISSRRESFGEFHNLLDDLLKDEEKFWRYLRMSSDTFKYILELIRTSIKKQNTNFRRSISPEERLMVTLR